MVLAFVEALAEVLSRVLFGVLQAIIILIIALVSELLESRTLRSCIELSRPGNSLMTAGFVLMLLLIAGVTDPKLILTAASVAVLVTAGGNAINDYYDRDIDAINKPNRPIPAKRIRSSVALAYSLILFALALLMCLFLAPYAVLIAMVNIFVLVSYGYSLKKTGFMGNLSISYLTASVFLFAAAVVGTRPAWAAGLIIGACAFLVTMGREIAKDIEDIKGDKYGGAETMPISIGTLKSSRVAVGFITLAVVFSPVPFLMGTFSPVYLAIILVTDILLAFSARQIWKKQDVKTAAKVQKMLKLAMLVALIAFLAGSYNIYELAGGLV